MTRRILFGFALAASAALVPAPANADGTQICLKVTVNGVINQSATVPCIPSVVPTNCGSHFLQFPPASSVTVTYCAPTPFPPFTP